jgi:hypothetical protein
MPTTAKIVMTAGAWLVSVGGIIGSLGAWDELWTPATVSALVVSAGIHAALLYTEKPGA